MWKKIVTDYLLRQERSQAWLASKAHVTPAHLNRCMNDHSEPSAQLLLRLVAAMNLYRTVGTEPIDLGTKGGEESP